MKKSHIDVYINDFDRFVSQNKKTKTKNTFVKVVYSVLVVKVYWLNIKKFISALMAHNLSDQKKEQSNLKLILNRYKFH